MELYDHVAYENSRHLTLRYSSSFGLSSKLFGKTIQPHIYAVYALVRIADEIVDTYKGKDSLELLNTLEAHVYRTLKTGYSTDLIVHAFCKTARTYGIDKTLIAPFFESMRMDLSPQTYDAKNYKLYIHGSAEVVGLMCLRVFLHGNDEQYKALAPGAAALGSAYQKVNFLRDLAADYKELGRLYFPDVTYDSFDETTKTQIIADIQQDFAAALPALRKLPASSRKATFMSYVYYTELLKKLERTPAATIKHTRVRVPSAKKLALLVKIATLGAPAK